MSFFDKYNGTSDPRLLRMERAIWPLIYSGLLVLVLGWFTDQVHGTEAPSLYAVGALALVSGLVLFFLRARHQDQE